MPAQPGQPLSIVILAAGQGKRMKSDLPKVLQPLAGKPLLRHVIDTACTLQPVSLHVVYGHGGDVVRGALADAPVSSWCLQAEQLGTGHAVQQALPALHDGELALILYGDVPLVSADTLRSLVALAGPKTMSLLTVMLEDPTGYGRIVRDARGKVRRIVRVGGFIQSTDTFTQQPKVLNGCSDLLVAVFGERGRHARAAVGVNALPAGAVVEVEMIVEIAD